MRGRRWAAAPTVWLWAAAAAASGGCAQILGVDWSSYAQGEGTGGMGGAGGSGSTGGTGGDGGAEGAQSSGGAGGSAGPMGTAGTEGGAGGAECSVDEERCSENGPQRCVDGRWEDETPCPAATPACDAGRCVPPSCVGLAETCGPNGNQNCCASAEVPGGSFNRGNDARYPATVSAFLLDRFEITVGRFRRFVEAYPASKPAAGAGAHPRIAGSGWDAAWDDNLPADAAALKDSVRCGPIYETWTNEAGDDERLPMNCLSWYVAFAFCAWDVGRLPTEAEWEYTAVAGDDQRPYPWSGSSIDEIIDGRYAVYHCTGDGSAPDSCNFSDIQPVGSRSPMGDGKWGHADLAGNVQEWVLDGFADYHGTCNDCATLTSASSRLCRGGDWTVSASGLRSDIRRNPASSAIDWTIGVRCARTP
jgi:formylglycine-generating enzyme required for sulfatase activity